VSGELKEILSFTAGFAFTGWLYFSLWKGLKTGEIYHRGWRSRKSEPGSFWFSMVSAGLAATALLTCLILLLCQGWFS